MCHQTRGDCPGTGGIFLMIKREYYSSTSSGRDLRWTCYGDFSAWNLRFNKYVDRPISSDSFVSPFFEIRFDPIPEISENVVLFVWYG